MREVENPITDEAEIVEMRDAIDAELAKTGIRYEIHHDEAGESWYVFIGAGHSLALDGGGSNREFDLTYWGPGDEWLWSHVDRHHQRSGPWPCRDLHAGAGVAEVARYVVDGLRTYNHDDCTHEGCVS